MKKLTAAVLILLFCLALISCGGGGGSSSSGSSGSSGSSSSSSSSGSTSSSSSSGGISVQTWQKMFGGNDEDEAESLCLSSSDGYVIAGDSKSTNIPGCTNLGVEDCYITKLDLAGNIQWQSIFGGNGNDQAYSISPSSDGGYIVVGTSSSTDIEGCTNKGQFDLYIVKLDSNGIIQWQKMFGGNNTDYARYITPSLDGGFFIAGWSHSTDISGCTNNGGRDYYVLKIDSDGVLQWQKMFGGSAYEFAAGICGSSDGSCTVVGQSLSTDISGCSNSGKEDWYVLNLDSQGDINWQKMFGGNDYDHAHSVSPTSDGGYIVTGDSKSTNITGCTNSGESDFYVMKLDKNGNTQWNKMFGGSGNDYGRSISPTSDGGYAGVSGFFPQSFIVAGSSESTNISGCTNNGKRDYYIIKLDSEGSIQWQKMFGGSEIESCYSILPALDGGYIFAGCSDSSDISGCTNNGTIDYYVVKVNSEGNL